MSNRTSVSFGCLPIIVTAFVLWALIFGWSWDGKHYSAGCSCDRGVELDRSAP